MCLLVLAWQAAPRYRLAVAANRDEYHERPAQALAKWPEPPGIIAGRDLRASGTWLGVAPERRLRPGVYGLWTELLDTPWPKLQRVRPGFEDWLARAAGSPAELFELLNDRTRVEDDAALPAGRSALPREWERILSAPFVLHPEYGTRCSTVLLEAPHGGVYLAAL